MRLPVRRPGDRCPACRRRGRGHAEVTLEKGGPERFDLLLAAEGIGSPTRRLLLGDRAERRSLGLATGCFRMPRSEHDGRVARWYNAPGGRCLFLRPDRHGTTRAVLTVRDEAIGVEQLPSSEQRAFRLRRFAGAVRETPRVQAELEAADDFCFEQIWQVRAAPIGDAAWCVSPISGMGTTLALVGSYVLAGELGRQRDHGAAFAAYDRVMRPFVEQAQDIPRFGIRVVEPRTRAGIALQRTALGLAAQPAVRRSGG